MKYMDLKDIKIKDSFASTTPKEKKMNNCRNFWNNNHEQDRYIVVDHNDVLVDGYIQYLVLKENNIKIAEIVISNKKRRKYIRKNKSAKLLKPKRVNYRECETIYIYGIHPNSSAKERVWRVPNSWSKDWIDCLSIGDTLFVNTKYGIAPIIITKVEKLNECPIDIPVKKIVRKLEGDNYEICE